MVNIIQYLLYEWYVLCFRVRIWIDLFWLPSIEIEKILMEIGAKIEYQDRRQTIYNLDGIKFTFRKLA